MCVLCPSHMAHVKKHSFLIFWDQLPTDPCNLTHVTSLTCLQLLPLISEGCSSACVLPRTHVLSPSPSSTPPGLIISEHSVLCLIQQGAPLGFGWGPFLKFWILQALQDCCWKGETPNGWRTPPESLEGLRFLTAILAN